MTGTTWPKHMYSILVTGVARFKINKIIQDEPYVVAKVETLEKFFNGNSCVSKDSVVMYSIIPVGQ